MYFCVKFILSFMISTIVFTLIVFATFGFAGKKYFQIYKNIRLGKDVKIDDQKTARLKNVILIAFGQKKMFKEWIPALLHLAIYAAFIFTQIELIEIFIDGFLGKHRFLYHLIEKCLETIRNKDI